MSKVINVDLHEIFTLLLEGKEVYVIDPDKDRLTNLMFEKPADILNLMNDGGKRYGNYGYFFIEKSGK